MYHAMGRRGVSFDLANIIKVLHARLSGSTLSHIHHHHHNQRPRGPAI